MMGESCFLLTVLKGKRVLSVSLLVWFLLYKLIFSLSRKERTWQTTKDHEKGKGIVCLHCRHSACPVSSLISSQKTLPFLLRFRRQDCKCIAPSFQQAHHFLQTSISLLFKSSKISSLKKGSGLGGSKSIS